MERLYSQHQCYSDNNNMKGDKKVHFKEAQEHSFNSSSLEASTNNSSSNERIPTTSKDQRPSSPSSFDRMPATSKDQFHRTHSFDGHSSQRNQTSNAVDKKHSAKRVRSHSASASSMYVGQLLTVSPADELIFHPLVSGDSFDTITLTNTLPHSVAFKVKTTSPEKFRVRPSSGIIRPENTEEIRVYLVSEHAEDISKEKFLIMAIDTQGKSSDLGQMFKETTSDKVMQHKLRCSLGTQEDLQEQTTSPNLKTSRGDNLTLKVDQLQLQTLRMQKQISMLLIVQFLTAFFLLLIMLLYSCFGKDLFTHLLNWPVAKCHTRENAD